MVSNPPYLIGEIGRLEYAIIRDVTAALRPGSPHVTIVPTRQWDGTMARFWARHYQQVLSRIADFQQHALGSYRWGKTHSLADYYHRAVALLECEGDILLDRPMLVEGIPVEELTHPDEAETAPPSGDGAEASDEIDEEGRGTRYRTLTGSIGGVAVVGVPDVVALDGDGTLRVCDYKSAAPATWPRC